MAIPNSSVLPVSVDMSQSGRFKLPDPWADSTPSVPKEMQDACKDTSSSQEQTERPPGAQLGSWTGPDIANSHSKGELQPISSMPFVDGAGSAGAHLDASPSGSAQPTASSRQDPAGPIGSRVQAAVQCAAAPDAHGTLLIEGSPSQGLEMANQPRLSMAAGLGDSTRPLKPASNENTSAAANMGGLAVRQQLPEKVPLQRPQHPSKPVPGKPCNTCLWTLCEP